MQNALILGATSSMARAISARLAKEGFRLFLGGRNLPEMERLQADLQIRYGAEVWISELDATDFESHPAFISQVDERLGDLDLAVFAIGAMGEQPEASHEASQAIRLIDVNFSAGVSLLAPVANQMARRGQGAIVGISSVAGDRARQSKYVYDAAKGGFSLYLQGLRNRLEPEGVRIYTVKPGFVDTSMTYGLPGLFLVAQPEQIADSIWRMLQKPSGIYYFPWFWRWIMLIIKSIPEFIFKKMKM